MQASKQANTFDRLDQDRRELFKRSTVVLTSTSLYGLMLGLTACGGGGSGGGGSSSSNYLLTGIVTTLVGTAGTSGTTDATGTAAKFTNPFGVAADTSGNLYVVDYGNHTIRKIVIATGVVTTFAGTAGTSGTTDATGTAAKFNNPTGIVIDNTSGNLYVADQGNHTIRKIVISTRVVTTLAGTATTSGSANGTGTAATFNFPADLALDTAGNLYVADNINHLIRKIVISSGVVTTLAGSGTAGTVNATGTSAQFRNPISLAIDTLGNLYVSDQLGHVIRKLVTSTAVVTTLAGTAGTSGSADGTGTAATFNIPRGLALDTSGNLYVADSNNHTIRKIVVATGVVTTLAGAASSTGTADGTTSAARFSTPSGLGFDSSGYLYVGDHNNHTIRKIT